MEITQLTGSKWITSCKMEERPCSRACISRLDTTVLEKNQIFIKLCIKGDQNTFIDICPENLEYFVPNYANWFCKSLLCKIKCPIAGSDLNGAKLWKNILSFCWLSVLNYFSSFKISSCFVSLSLKMALILFWQFFYFY